MSSKNTNIKADVFINFRYICVYILLVYSWLSWVYVLCSIYYHERNSYIWSSIICVHSMTVHITYTLILTNKTCWCLTSVTNTPNEYFAYIHFKNDHAYLMQQRIYISQSTKFINRDMIGRIMMVIFCKHMLFNFRYILFFLSKICWNPNTMQPFTLRNS